MLGRASRARPSSNTARREIRWGPCAGVSYGGNVIRQVLLAHSDIERSYSYAFSGAPPFPVQDYVATIRVTPIVADGAAFVEWWATFDCAAEDRDHWVRHFEQEGFAKWLAALRHFLSDGGARADRRARARTCLA